MNESWLEAWMVTSQWEGVNGIPEIVPVSELRERPWGRDPEMMLKWEYSEMIGEIEKYWADTIE